MAWGGEVIKRLTQAQREVNDIHRHFDETAEHCTQLEVRLADLEAFSAEEEREVEALETQELRIEDERAALMAEKRSLVAEKEAITSELDAALVKKTALEVELAETKARAEEEIGRLRSETANAWDLGKEDFLKSSEFDNLCVKKSLDYFKTGFESCVAQFRANGYSEEEHPAPFLNVNRALEELSEGDEEADEEDEEEDDEGFTPPSSLKQ
ncbi:protein CROWDED NUCLEI 4-like [Dorcoceras hygrometricum]|uniref:Protein CROWDED NUCLEI 4-like n=1 Tax=Dorcoceras hygrometricum TaxID=472368 RepID=A0A2Z7AI03_9LAMI|nr:protein CROWDED NUCLEI 4-like [Dorcoceras hygrometricum]